jgi:hypothetical protein
MEVKLRSCGWRPTGPWSGKERKPKGCDSDRVPAWTEHAEISRGILSKRKEQRSASGLPILLRTWRGGRDTRFVDRAGRELLPGLPGQLPGATTDSSHFGPGSLDCLCARKEVSLHPKFKIRILLFLAASLCEVSGPKTGLHSRIGANNRWEIPEQDCRTTS